MAEARPRRTRSAARKEPRELGARELEEAALRYLNRFDATAKKLATHLGRLARRSSNHSEASNLIPALIERYTRSGLVDDRRYAETRARSLRARGASSRLIAQKLLLQGVAREIVSEVLNGASHEHSTDLEAALVYARRKRLGSHRPKEQQLDQRRRDLARLARQGFDYDVCVRALGLGGDDDF